MTDAVGATLLDFFIVGALMCVFIGLLIISTIKQE